MRFASRFTPVILLFLAIGRHHANADDRPALSRFVPANDLLLFAEFDGIDAHQAAWDKSAASKILTGTTLGELAKNLGAQTTELVRNAGRPNLPPSNDVLAAIQAASRGGFVVAFNGKSAQDWKGMFVIRGTKSPDLERVISLSLIAGSRNARATTSMKAGRQITIASRLNGQSLALWREGDDHVICDATLLERILETVDGKLPNASTNPVIAELRKPEAGFEPIAIAFLDPAAFGPPSPESAKQGLDGIKRVDLRIGFDGEAMTTITRIIAPVPRKGLLSLIDQPSFNLKSLPPLPSGLTGFTVFSIEPAKVYDQVLNFMEAGSEDPSKGVKVTELRLRQSLGIDLKSDLLAHIGPKVAIYASPMKPNAEGVASSVLDLRIAIEKDGSVAGFKAIGQLLEALKAQLIGGPLAHGPMTDGKGYIYTFPIPREAQLPGPLEALEPVVAVGKDRIVIASTRKAAEAALTVGTDGKASWSPPEGFASLSRSMPKDMFLLSINDPRETIPPLVASLPFLLESMNKAVEEVNRGNGMRQPQGNRIPIEIDPTKVPTIEDLARPMFPGWLAVSADSEGLKLITRDAFPNLASPGAVGMVIALALPAVQAWREAARRAQCVNHLKQIGLAMHNYHAATGAFPKPSIIDKDGKPLLSWRVAVLPYLDQQALYNKFRLDEPWDSPHNKPLLDEMPAVFSCTTAPKADSKGTHYRVFAGNGALFEEKQDIGLRHVTDGSSNTIMVVETKDTVLWTKPDDLAFDPKKPAPFGAGSFHPGGYNVLFADGAVRFMSNNVNLNVIRALITRAAGEVIAADAF